MHHPNLEQSIAEWRRSIQRSAQVAPDTLDELESHVRETVEQLVRSGIGEAEAFHRAITELGSSPAIASEFRKLTQPMWLPVKVVTGTGVAGALALVILLLNAFQHRRWDTLLAAHVFAVTLGYSATLLLGVLGICFVCQRCCGELPPCRLQPLFRVGLTFVRVATCLTAVGIVLGMFWSEREWGRFWSWDRREIGALCVVLWLIGFLCAHHFRRVTIRGLFVWSILGCNVAGLAWFWPDFRQVGSHSYGVPGDSWFLLAAVTANLLLFLIGQAPAGWLRLRKT